MDYFARLAQQALGGEVSAAVRPRLPGPFEPGGAFPSIPASPELIGDGPLVTPPRASLRSPDHVRPALPPNSQPERTANTPAAEPPTPAPIALQPQAGLARQPTAAVRPPAAAPGAIRSVVAGGAPNQVAAVGPASQAPGADSIPSSPRRGVAIAPALVSSAPVGVRAQVDAGALAPVIRVSIGRVEVRAVMRPAAAPPRTVSAPQPAAAPLEDYLRADKGGRPR